MAKKLQITKDMMDKLHKGEEISIDDITLSFPVNEEKIEIDDKTKFVIDLKHLLDKHVMKEGDTIEKFSAKGKATGKLKQGTIRKKLGVKKGEKIPTSKIDKEIARLRRKDKDKDKPGAQLSPSDSKYLKGLTLSKTLRKEGSCGYNRSMEGKKLTTPGGLKETIEFVMENNPGLTKEEIVKEVQEIKKLGENLTEGLCARGKNYIAARKRAGEKSSAYLSGRGVKVCKGQIKGSDGKRKKG
tara:strand:- start:72 stop:797 length:726 start_codon:yes stop_codon:yes gene_type:complete